MSATALRVDAQTASSSDLNDVSAETRMATSLPGTVKTYKQQTSDDSHGWVQSQHLQNQSYDQVIFEA